jgi:hypothetical protein
MLPDLKQCKTHALKLAPKERAILAERLITSLDSLNESENEHLWVEEAERRYKGFRKGKITARLAKDVLHDARIAIR